MTFIERVKRYMQSRTVRRVAFWVLIRIVKAILDNNGIHVLDGDSGQLFNAYFPAFDAMMGVLVIQGRVNQRIDFNEE
jgi:hypothetical protein